MQVEATSEQSHHDPVPSSDRLIGLLDPLSFRSAPNTDKEVLQKGKTQLFVFRARIHSQPQACTCICHHLMEGQKREETEKASGFSPKPESTTKLSLTTDCSSTPNLCQCQGKKGLVLAFSISDVQLVCLSLVHNRKEKLTWAVTDEMQPKKLFLSPL